MNNDRFKFRVKFECNNCGKKFNEIFQLIPFARYSIGCECGKVLKTQTDITIISIKWCTGLKDKHGTLIFEGDEIYNKESNYSGHIRWLTCGFCVAWGDDKAIGGENIQWLHG